MVALSNGSLTWLVARFRCLTGEQRVRINVALTCRLNDPVRQARRLLAAGAIPPGFFGGQPVAHILFVEAGGHLAFNPLVGGPKTRRVRRECLISQDQLTAVRVNTELELGVSDDDAALASDARRLRICLLYTSDAADE